jgi:predicted nuclease with TOPRIM domain
LKEASIIQEAEIEQLRKELAEKNKQSESNSDLNSSFTDLKKKYNELLYKTQQYESILSQLNLTSKEPCEVSDEDIDNLYLQSLSNKNVERHKSAFFVYDKNGNKFIPKSYYVISNVIEGR